MLPKKPDKKGHIFHLTSETLDANFRRLKKKTTIDDLHFHDTRHEATTRLAKLSNMNVLRLAKITGHKDLKYLMIYFNETAEEMVETLDVAGDEPISPNLDSNLIKALIKQVAVELKPALMST